MSQPFDAAGSSTIRSWLLEAQRRGATHLIVVDDTFSYENYPVYVDASQDVRVIAQKYDGPDMQRLMEVYSLALDIEDQLKETRAFHWD